MTSAERNPHDSRESNATDSELIERSLAGNHVAFQLLMDRYQGVIKGYLWGKLPSDLDAEDLFQEIFISVYRNLARLRDRRRFGPWLVTLARNCLNDALRARALRFRARGSDDTVDEPRDRAQNPRGNAAARELSRAVTEAIGSIPDKYRLVLSMRLLEEASIVEIAARLGITENAARVRLHRGLAKLHARLARLGIDLPGEL